MHPILFTIGSFEVHAYGVTLFLGILTGYLMVRAELLRRGETEDHTRLLMIVAVAGGWFGSKLWYLAEHLDRFRADPVGELFAGYGQVFLGALLGGICALAVLLRRTGRPLVPVADIAFPATMAAGGIGRLGCMLSGDGDYGVPSRLPFPLAVDMSGGIVPPHRHPGIDLPFVLPETPVLNTPLLEFLALTGAAFWLHRLHRTNPPVSRVASLSLLVWGWERFTVEFWRLNPDVLGPFSTPQLIGLAMGLAGLVLVGRCHRTTRDRSGGHSHPPN